jgi:hypothetical protein
MQFDNCAALNRHRAVDYGGSGARRAKRKPSGGERRYQPRATQNPPQAATSPPCSRPASADAPDYY